MRPLVIIDGDAISPNGTSGESARFRLSGVYRALENELKNSAMGVDGPSTLLLQAMLALAGEELVLSEPTSLPFSVSP